MQIDIVARPAASAARIKLNRDETVVAEVGAMIAMSKHIHVDTTSRSRGGGSILKGLKRMFSGESFFLNHFQAVADGQEVIMSPALLGDIAQHRLDAATLVVQSSGWLAATGEIDIDTTWQGLSNALLGGEGAFWVKCSGTGDVLLNSFGAIYEVDVNGGYTVDTGHIVAFEDTLSFRIGKASQSLIGSILGGEGLVCKFKGVGKLYCQTHNPPGFGRILGPKLRQRPQ